MARAQLTGREAETLYREWAGRSAALYEEAAQVFPGGDTRASAHFKPFPNFIERGEGPILYDAEGHQLIDFMNNFTSLLHGHAYPPIVEAVIEQIQRGSAYAAPAENQVALAKLLVDRVPSLERMRFCSAGSEATLMTLRCARAHTGRDKIMKIEGGYHGSYELAEVSLVPIPDRCGQLNRPASIGVDDSFPQSVLDDTIVAPYNHIDYTLALLREHADDLAAVILEPVLGSMGMIPATRDYLAALREETARLGIVLIFDEVISLRVDLGGAQALHGVTPDLTAMGKIVGGGLPVGAFGGREDLMAHFDPRTARPVMHASTFSGNPLTMAAGYAAMSNYLEEDCVRINRQADRLRDGFNNAFTAKGIKGQAIGLGSLTNLHLSDRPLNHARDALDGILEAGHITKLIHLGQLRRGIFAAPRLMFCVSTVTQDRHIGDAVSAFDDTLDELLPVIRSERPALLH